jgi:Domain of unknown function (DUF6532)
MNCAAKLTGPPQRTKPYRNARIINVIREQFFTGGTASFAHRFNHRFLVRKDSNGVPMREVPIPMVALVATAVSVIVILLHHANVMYQIYVALDEWRDGVNQPLQFSTTVYLDVYNSHVASLRTIEKERTKAFHLMMQDIYTQAR